VQGDVGSGKTIIAFLAMIMAAENGFQSWSGWLCSGIGSSHKNRTL
jgi:hypothetical protein